MDDFRRSVTKRSSSNNSGTDHHKRTAIQTTTTVTRNIRASVFIRIWNPPTTKQKFSSKMNTVLRCSTVLAGQGVINVWVWDHTQLHSPHSERLLRMSDVPVAEPSTVQHTTITRDRHHCLLRDSNPRFQQASSHRPSHLTKRALDRQNEYRVVLILINSQQSSYRPLQ